MKHVLLCTDCSANAKKAVDQCLFLLKDQSVQYTILYSYSIDDTFRTDLVAQNDELKYRAKSCLKSEVQRIKSLPYVNQGISIVPRTAFGKTENVVQRFINKNKTDFIVFGHQGINYSSQQLFGSTSEKLLFRIERPKLVVPQFSEKATIAETVVIVQESEWNDLEWWSSITDFSKNQKSNFKMIALPSKEGKTSTLSIPSFIEKQLSSVLDFTHYNSTEINEQLNKTLQDEIPLLIHLNIRDKQFASQLLRQQLPQNSIYNKIPFLIQPFH